MLAALFAVAATQGSAQLCDVPASVRSMVPTEPLPEVSFASQWVTGADGAAIPLGVGHLHYSYEESGLLDLPPGVFDWTGVAALPISATAGMEPDVWVVDGWIVREGGVPTPLSREALLETGYEEVSVIVLQARPDGWLQIRYALGAGDEGTGWIPQCALSTGSAKLTLSRWRDWLVEEHLRGSISPLFFRADVPGPLFSGPAGTGERLDDIGSDYSLYPIEVQGEWMRVRVEEPSDYCEFAEDAANREGWVRWSTPESGPSLWYFTRGC